MDIYATEVFHLLHLSKTSNEMNERTKCLAFANYFTDAEKLQELRSWWDSIVSHGPNTVCYPNTSNSWLTVKLPYFDDVIKIFEGTFIKITVERRKYLGEIVRSKKYKQQYVLKTVQNWIHKIERLSDITKDFPHET